MEIHKKREERSAWHSYRFLVELFQNQTKVIMIKSQFNSATS